MWHIFDSGKRSAVENMQLDADMLADLEHQPRPILHFYEWEGNCATYGYFTDPAQFLDLEAAARLGLSLARRSTGGGIVFHIWDMAFSVLVPAHCPEFSVNTLENYAFVNQAVLGAVEALLAERGSSTLIEKDFEAKDTNCSHFCMAKPTKYDVIREGRKIVGAAQRKTKGGFLHQGTISLVMPAEEYLRSVLLPGTSVLEAIQAFTFPLLGASASLSQLQDAKLKLKAFLTTHLTDASLNLYPNNFKSWFSAAPKPRG